MTLTDDAPALKQYLFEMRFKPRPYYQAGALVRDPDDVPASLVGHMLTQPIVRTEAGEQRLDDVLGESFALVGLNDVVPTASALSHALWSRLQPRLVQICTASSGSPSRSVRTVECEQQNVQALRAHRDQLLLVRPDRFVAGAIAPAQIDQFAEKYDALLRAPAPTPMRTPRLTLNHPPPGGL
jgi:3-(3-hydroxy-phenyl)propionate hydroxylase